MSEYSDLRINGSGRTSGGTFNAVRINGSGCINGDVVCKDFVINGSGEATGKVESNSLRVSGSGRFGSEIKAGDIRVSGSAYFDAGIDCTDINISGSADIKKGITAKNVKINGSVKIIGDCNADAFASDGVFEIGGLLNADRIDIHLYWSKSTAREIGGEKITVELGNRRFGVVKSILTLTAHNPSLQADVIEGNDISLENTTARIVRGNNVSIGKNCSIGLVEYKGFYQKSNDARVDKEVKL